MTRSLVNSLYVLFDRLKNWSPSQGYRTLEGATVDASAALWRQNNGHRAAERRAANSPW